MNLLDRILYVIANRHQTTMASRIAGVCFLLLIGLIVIFVGVSSGESLWLIVGAIWTALPAIALVILIIINIRRNRPRW